MHILYVAPGYKPAYKIGGPIESVSSAAEALVRKGHRVTVFTTNGNLTEDLDIATDTPIDVNGVQVWYFKRTEPFKKYLPFIPYMAKSLGFLYAPRMRSALEEIMRDIDVVHTHLPFIYPTFIAARVAIRCSKPLFYSQRGVFDAQSLRFRAWKKRIYIKCFEVPLLKRADTLISLTDVETQNYRALGVNTRCEVIPNGVNVDNYWQQVPDEWHARLNIPKDAAVILFLGRLHPTKGADRLIRAFLSVSDRLPRAYLVCAGPDEFNLQQELERMTGGNAARTRILFPQMVSGDYKKALLARANLFCLPSNGEGFSITVLEAMASRTAVLLSPGCHFDAVETLGAGKVVPHDPESISRALLELLPNTALLEKMAAKGLELVKSDYSWDRIVDKLLCVYQRAVRERKTL